MTADTIPSRLFEQAKRRPHAPAYFWKEGGVWRRANWRDYADNVKRAGKALLALGLAPESTASILGFNRPEWALLDLAIMCIGGAAAGIYTTCSSEEVRYIIHHAESPLVLIEDQGQWEKIKAEREQLPLLKHVVTMRGAPKIDDPLVLSWEEFMSKGDAIEDRLFFERMEAIKPEALATLIYTSGTTGPPKGVMLSHKNLAWTATASAEINQISGADVSLSYLPLSHIAEQMFTLHLPISSGAAVYFAESLEKVPANLKEVEPTVLFGVPRIWEKFYAGISVKLKEAKGAKKLLVDWAMGVGRKANERKNQGRSLDRLLELQYKLAQRLVFTKLKSALGLGRGRVFASGAAPISKEILEFFSGLDIVIFEVYGQSEDNGPTSFNVPGRTRFGTVGPIFPGVEVKIAEDSEILVRGPNVFLGYYKDPAATAETLIDGWLHSGDLGTIEDGFLSITGRKKEILITSGGKNIAPKNLEAALKNHSLVSEAVIIGDRRNYLTALIALDPEAATRFMKEHNLSGPPHENAKLRAALEQAVEEVNRRFARVEAIRKFTILPRPLTQEDGELTPTLKVKRKAVYAHFSAQIEAMYQE